MNGPRPAVREQLDSVTKGGLIALVESRADDDWLAEEFPVRCRDGERNYVYATDRVALNKRIMAVIPGLERPWARADSDTDDPVFDLVEFAGRYVALPQRGAHHVFPDHYALKFDRRAGAARFREDVNELLSRAGAAYRMTDGMLIERVGPPEVRKAMSDLRPDTGDADLDDLIDRARSQYVSRRADDRDTALQCLWGAFERLKTLELPVLGKKNASAELLLNQIASTELRDVVREDMRALTDIGNRFRIRHHETYVISVPPEAFDYFIGRLANVLLVLLKHSGRLAG